MKVRLLIATICLSISFESIQANAFRGDLGDVLRDSTGKILLLNQAEAIGVCKALGGHLPTARELAFGVLGPIAFALHPPVSCDDLGNCELDPRDRDEFRQIIAKNPGEIAFDKFYYTKEHYKGTSWELKPFSFWSASIKDTFYPQNSFSLVLQAESGVLDSFWVGQKEAVRCADGR